MSGSGPVAVTGSFSRSAGRRAGSASFASRSSRVPVVASHQACWSSNRFQSSKVKVKPASVVSPWPDHADAALAAALQPLQHAAMDVRPVVEGLHHVHDASAGR